MKFSTSESILVPLDTYKKKKNQSSSKKLHLQISRNILGLELSNSKLEFFQLKTFSYCCSGLLFPPHVTLTIEVS